MKKIFAALFTFGLLVWTISAPAEAQTGNIKIMMKNVSGHPVNGTATARKSGVAKTCNTAAGTCTISGVPAGVWAVSGESFGGLADGPYNATVAANKTVSVELLVKEKTSNTSGGTPVDGSSSGQSAKPINTVTKDLSQGKLNRAVGSVQDSKNRAVNGVVTVKKDGSVKGQCRTADGTFEIKDILPGVYTFEIKSNDGRTAVKSVTIDNKSIAVVNFSL